MEHAQPPTLLLVDDEDNVLAALRRALRNEGYRILSTHDPVEALALADAMANRGEEIDVVLSDQRMAAMSGVEFLRRIKTSHPDTVRLVLSGYADLQTITDAINEGSIYKFLNKPWDDAQLKAILREAFQRKTMKDENRRLTNELAEANARLTVANEDLRQLLEEKQRQNLIIESALDTTREIIQLIPWPVLGVDDEGMIALANPAAIARFGRCDTLLGMPAEECLPAPLTDCLDGPLPGSGALVLDGRAYRIVCRTMGRDSHSRGRLLALLPEDTP